MEGQINMENDVKYFFEKLCNYIVDARSKFLRTGGAFPHEKKPNSKFAMETLLSTKDTFRLKDNFGDKYIMIDFLLGKTPSDKKSILIEQWIIEYDRCDSKAKRKIDTPNKLLTKFSTMLRSLVLLSNNIPFIREWELKKADFDALYYLDLQIIDNRQIPNDYVGWMWSPGIETERYEKELVIQTKENTNYKLSIQVTYLKDFGKFPFDRQPLIEDLDFDDCMIVNNEEEVVRNHERPRFPVQKAGRFRSGSEQIFAPQRNFLVESPNPIKLSENNSFNNSPKGSIVSNPPFEIININADGNGKKAFDRKSLSNENLCEMDFKSKIELQKEDRMLSKASPPLARTHIRMGSTQASANFLEVPASRLGQRNAPFEIRWLDGRASFTHGRKLSENIGVKHQMLTPDLESSNFHFEMEEYSREDCNNRRKEAAQWKFSTPGYFEASDVFDQKKYRERVISEDYEEEAAFLNYNQDTKLKKNPSDHNQAESESSEKLISRMQKQIDSIKINYSTQKVPKKSLKGVIDDLKTFFS